MPKNVPRYQLLKSDIICFIGGLPSTLKNKKKYDIKKNDIIPYNIYFFCSKSEKVIEQKVVKTAKMSFKICSFCKIWCFEKKKIDVLGYFWKKINSFCKCVQDTLAKKGAIIM